MDVKDEFVDVLSGAELEALLNAPSIKSILGLRNRVVMTLMAVCGLKVSEVCNLRVVDVELDVRKPFIRVCNTGKKERLVFMDSNTIDLMYLWLERKPRRFRALFPVIKSGKRTFGKAEPGRAISPNSVRNMVRHFAKKAGIKKRVHPGMLRKNKERKKESEKKIKNNMLIVIKELIELKKYVSKRIDLITEKININ